MVGMKRVFFNFEGGCYAKVINLNKESEPDIYNAIKKGSLLENIIADKNGKVDFKDIAFSGNGSTMSMLKSVLLRMLLVNPR